MDVDVDKQLAQASKAFGALRKAVFMNRNLGLSVKRSLSVKRRLYNACVLPVLLYGAECWVTLAKHNKKLNTFHHRYLRIILGISNRQQWSQHIAIKEGRRRWGDIELVVEKVRKQRLEWLGHLARMPDSRLPKSILFGWLSEPRPRCGPRRRWRYVVSQDLAQIGIGETEWHDKTRSSRDGWRALINSGINVYD